MMFLAALLSGWNFRASFTKQEKEAEAGLSSVAAAAQQQPGANLLVSSNYSSRGQSISVVNDANLCPIKKRGFLCAVMF